MTADETGTVWLFLHSGSRGVGNKIAIRHIAVAAKLCELWWIPLPDRDLAYLVEGTPEFDRYLAELTWAQHFALLNREEMMDRVLDRVRHWLGSEVIEQERINATTTSPFGSVTSARTCGCLARGRSGPAWASLV